MDTQTILSIVIAVAAVIAFIIYLVWQIKKKGLKEFAIDMILKAEDLFEQGQNNEKMNYVVKAIKSFLGTTKIGILISMFVTEENIENFIQEVFDGLKKALDYVPNKESGDK